MINARQKTLLATLVPRTVSTTLTTALAVASLSAQADPAVFRNGVMTIPEGAIVSGTGGNYYTDIRLAMNEDGSLSVTGATANSLVSVDTVDVQVMESLPMQVSLAVSGNLSVPCVELLDPAISYADNTFTVILAESNLGPAESCIAVLEPFDTTVSLDVAGLAAGTYNVDVNGVSAEFTFDTDNSPL